MQCALQLTCHDPPLLWRELPTLRELPHYLARFPILKETPEQVIQTFRELEKSHWTYLDEYQKKCPHHYPKLNFRSYCQFLLESSDSNELLREFDQLQRLYFRHKKQQPTAGAVFLDGDRILLVRVVNSTVYSLPKGKAEPGETVYQTAVREVAEETGVDLSLYADRDQDPLTLGKTKFYVVHGFRGDRFDGYNRNEIVDAI